MSTLELKLDTPHGEIRASVPFITEDKVTSLLFTDHGMKRISAIKEIRAYLMMTLKEAKDYVESLPKNIEASDLHGVQAKYDTDAGIDPMDGLYRALIACGATVTKTVQVSNTPEGAVIRKILEAFLGDRAETDQPFA